MDTVLEATPETTSEIAVEKLQSNQAKTTITLPCRRCNNTEREQPTPGLCSWCYDVAHPDSDTSTERQEEIDRRIRQMRKIHDLEIAMDGYQRAQWIEAGWKMVFYGVLDGHKRGECREGGIGLGPK